MRLFVKVQRERYSSDITKPEDIPVQIDDLIGLRVVCTHQSDQVAVVEILKSLPLHDGSGTHGLWVEPDSERDYILHPKPSGYRAYHVNLVTPLARPDGMHPVRAELQVRTLLQDGWGELTHEDTYKPDHGPVSTLVTVLSRRMGELLATVDDIAQDIQDDLSTALHLEHLPEEQVTQPEPLLDEEADDAEEAAVTEDLVGRELRFMISQQSRPVSLAVLANRLQGTFGADIRQDWFGHGGFKAFILSSAPDAFIAPVGPSYLVPPGSVPDETWPSSLKAYLSAIDTD